MIYHRLNPRICQVLLLVLGMTAASHGQQLPPAIYASNDVTPQRPVIDQFVDDLVKKLAGADPAACSAARDALTKSANIVGTTPAFYDQYADALNGKILAIANNKDARVRLNAAIVIAKVAAKAGNARLAPAADALLKDTCDGVVLWALQAAKHVVPALLAANDLKMAVTVARDASQAAQLHGSSPAIIEEAYRTVLLDPASGGIGSNDPLRNINPPQLGGFVQIPIDFFAYRVKQYNDASPVQPTAETAAVLFLVKEKVWTAESKQQQTQVVHLMRDLLKGAAKQKAAGGPQELLLVIRRTGDALESASKLGGITALGAAAKSVRTLKNDASSSDIDAAVALVEAAIPPAP